MTLQGRTGNLVGAAACAAMLAYALYAEKVLGLAPCPLCMFQRVGVLAMGIVFAIAALHGPRRGGARVYAVLVILAAATTAAVAARHVYVQALPPGAVPACGATLDFLLEAFPLFEVIRKVMTGGGECARIDWRLLGLSMPAWVLVASTLLGVYGACVNSVRKTPR
ncbi:MAG: disulfide bond formation protein B [Steroidobacteraceae bacterium]